MKLVLAITLVLTALASPARAQNFYALAKEKHCESVMPSLRTRCQNLNVWRKEKACQAESGCELTKQEEQAAEYKNATERMARGEVPDADKENFQRSIDRMKSELDARKAEAGGNARAARTCADARQEIYDFFDDEVIPQTEKAVADAVTRKKGLVEELDKAKENARAAKEKRDALEGADPEKDRARWEEYTKAKDEYERATEAARQSENNLGQFNSVSGDDPADGGKRLVDSYKEEQKGHKEAIDGQVKRAENCEKVERMSY